VAALRLQQTGAHEDREIGVNPAGLDPPADTNPVVLSATGRGEPLPAPTPTGGLERAAPGGPAGQLPAVAAGRFAICASVRRPELRAACFRTNLPIPLAYSLDWCWRASRSGLSARSQEVS
jgi:hypothetical protein